MPTTPACEHIVRDASDFVDGALDAETTTAVEEHLADCVDCTNVVGQLRDTVGVLRRRPRRTVARSTAAAVTDSMAGNDEAQAAFARHASTLKALALELDQERADDLVQEAFLTALERGEGAFECERLLDTLVSLATTAPDVELGSTQDNRDRNDPANFDPDADASELFYPEFYADGPDAGGWIEPTNAWGNAPTVLDPADDLATEELYGVVDAAIDDLDDTVAQIITLVDIEGFTAADAAAILSVDEADIRRALSVGRHHVRGALDGFVTA